MPIKTDESEVLRFRPFPTGRDSRPPLYTDNLDWKSPSVRVRLGVLCLTRPKVMCTDQTYRTTFLFDQSVDPRAILRGRTLDMISFLDGLQLAQGEEFMSAVLAYIFMREGEFSVKNDGDAAFFELALPAAGYRGRARLSEGQTCVYFEHLKRHRAETRWP